MEKLTLTVDLTGVVDKNEVLKQFNKALKFWDESEYETHPEIGNWDSFNDDIQSLHTQSSTVIEKQPEAVHLVLKNVHRFKENNPEDYKTLLEILSENTNKEERYDKLAFTFEITNDSR